MEARILDGRAIAESVRAEIRARAEALKSEGVVPGLGVLLVGDNPASRSYVSAKEKACAEIGLYSREVTLPKTAARSEILDAVCAFNDDPQIDGLLVQLPLPDSSIEQEVIETILPEKDVDGFHPVNIGRMMVGLPTYLPCTPHGVVQILQRSGIAIEGAHVVIVGRSNIVGRPLAHLLTRKGPGGNATVTMCHTRTRDVAFHTRQADIVVAAAGRPGTITADMIREGAAVVDVGVNRVPDASKKTGFRLVGDADFEGCRRKASAITPVPGGVGPMTIAMLMYNTLEAAIRRRGGAA